MAAGRDLDPPAGRAVGPLRAADAGRRADDPAGRAARRPSRRDRAADAGRRGRLRRADRPRRHDLHAALRDAHVRRELRLRARAASACRCRPRCSSACATLTGAPQEEIDGRGGRGAAAFRGAPCPCTWSRLPAGARTMRVRAITKPAGALGTRGRSRVHRRSGRRCRAAARARAGSRRAARCHPSAASIPTTCSRSSSSAARRSRSRRSNAGRQEAITP